jgi:endonuclease YncB( thermonuclease family)
MAEENSTPPADPSQSSDPHAGKAVPFPAPEENTGEQGDSHHENKPQALKQSLGAAVAGFGIAAVGLLAIAIGSRMSAPPQTSSAAKKTGSAREFPRPPQAATPNRWIDVPTYEGGRANIPETFSGRVTHVPDADDVVVTSNMKRFKVRLAEIDCPEFKGNQPYYNEALKETRELALEKDVKVKYRMTNEQWNRIVGWITLPNGKDLSRELIRRGAAWHYREYSDHLQELDALQAEACRAKRGLWGLPAPPIYPQEWRRSH